MEKTNKTLESTFIVISITIISKILGFLKQALIAFRYGSNPNTDAFFVSLSIVTIFSLLITETVNTTLIPILSDVEFNKGKKGKLSYLNNFINIIFLGSLLLIILGFFLTPLLLKVMGKGFSIEQYRFSVLLTRIALPIVTISGLSGIFRGFLHSESEFRDATFSIIPRDIFIVIFLMLLGQKYGVLFLMIVTVISELSRLFVLIPSSKKKGYYYARQINLNDPFLQSAFKLMPPVFLSIGVSDLNNIIDKSMASTLKAGSISALNYSSILTNVIHSIFILGLLTVVFPTLSEKAKNKQYKEFKKIFGSSLNIILLVTVPAMVGIIILSTPIVKLAFQRGQFDEVAANVTSEALMYYSIGLVGIAIKSLLVRVFHALQDTKTPLKNSIYTLLINIFFNFLLIRFMGVNGLALASSLSAILTSLLLLYYLRRKIGPLGLSSMIQSAIKITISSAIMGLVIYFMYHYSMRMFGSTRLIELVLVVLTVVVGFMVYLVFLYLFKVEELHFLVDRVKAQLGRS